MTNIEEVEKIVTMFLKNTLHTEDVKIIKTSKLADGWYTEAEAYEESSFIKALGLPTRVKDRNIYDIKLNTELEVESYEQKH
ncbi:MAG: hypothetical protein HY934_07000 [Candidatus Firestonebacteria bacterium]|nr:hypothetical protein [Candidatus Firestonebacteria bacterium]